MKPRHFAMLAVLIMLIAGFAALVRQIESDADHRTVAPVPSFAPVSPVGAPSPASSISAAPAKPHVEAAVSALPDWAARMHAERMASGRLARLRAEPGEAIRNRAQPGFRVEDSTQAIARARDLLKELSPSLGIRAEYPLADPQASGDSVSSQVSFHETVGGVPTAPQGTVTLHIGPEGELISLNSDYVSDIQEANHTGATPFEGGRPVLWISPFRGEGPSPAYHAYEYNAQGRQTVVDSESGRILFEHDRRVN